MYTNNLTEASFVAVAAGTVARAAETAPLAANAGESSPVDTLIKDLKDPNDNVRTRAWLSANTVGAPAIKPLAELMTNTNVEVALAAKHGLWRIVYREGHPGGESEKKAVIDELIKLLADSQPPVVRVEVLWLISEIGGDESVESVAALLANPGLREDARMALQHIPGDKSLEALKAGLAVAPDDFKPNLAQSLRHRGFEVPEIPSGAMKPSKKTKVKPVGR